MSKNLVIVESPAKAKTIEKYLGKDYKVTSSFGHIRDLPKAGMSIDIENDFSPKYEVSPDKKKVVTELKKLKKTVETVWLATDEDREGEAIAWHLAEVLKLDEKNSKRIVFHEITKSAITHAVENPRQIDQNLVDAQQARRVLDRLVGYELSPVLWKKVRRGLSAGRVQSVSVRLIVEREHDIELFESVSSFKVTVEFLLEDKKILKTECSTKFSTEEDVKKFLEDIVPATFLVKQLQTKPTKRSPSAPFTTSTLQQEASRKAGFSPKKTMMVAQKLYEAGQITYMRTDSVNLSSQALAQAKTEISTRYGKEYVKTRKYKIKSNSAQEAHEAIRPTDFSVNIAKGDAVQKRLYDLIWKRTIASQMADAQMEKTNCQIEVSTRKEKLSTSGEIIKFDGFLKVYTEGTDENPEGTQDDKILPPLKESQILNLEKILARESFTRPPARYTEAGLIKKLEEEGIGRPSTYAPTISTIQDRGYIEKSALDGKERIVHMLTYEINKNKIEATKIKEITGADQGKLVPTEIGKIVNDFLVKHFSAVVDYQFTVKVEAEFDKIATGKEQWNTMISGFYTGFHETVEKSEEISREEASQARELGNDPKTGKLISVRIGRFGSFVELGKKDEKEKSLCASLEKNQTMDTITLEQAIQLLEEKNKFPRLLGQDNENEDITVNTGRFGLYLKCGKLNVSLKKDIDDPFELTLERAFELISEKKQAEKEKMVKVFEGSDIKIQKGPFGVYITDGKKNTKIPKKHENPIALTLKECEELIAKAPEKKR